jgi:phage gp46-like protein
MQSWKMDPTRGDYVLEKGSPVQTNSLVMPAYFRMKTKRQEWLYAPDALYGSDLHLIKKRTTSQDSTLVEKTAARALQPIVDDLRASEVSIDATEKTRNGVAMQVEITDAQGNVERLVIPGLGV